MQLLDSINQQITEANDIQAVELAKQYHLKMQDAIQEMDKSGKSKSQDIIKQGEKLLENWKNSSVVITQEEKALETLLKKAPQLATVSEGFGTLLNTFIQKKNDLVEAEKSLPALKEDLVLAEKDVSNAKVMQYNGVLRKIRDDIKTEVKNLEKKILSLSNEVNTLKSELKSSADIVPLWKQFEKTNAKIGYERLNSSKLISNIKENTIAIVAILAKNQLLNLPDHDTQMETSQSKRDSISIVDDDTRMEVSLSQRKSVKLHSDALPQIFMNYSERERASSSSVVGVTNQLDKASISDMKESIENYNKAMNKETARVEITAPRKGS